MAALGLVLLAAGCIPYSEGSRTGIVTKISHKGWLCKSWEGELQQLGFKGTPAGGIAANIFEFSTENAAIAQQLEAASRSGQQVTLYYKQEKLVSPCRASTQYFIVGVH